MGDHQSVDQLTSVFRAATWDISCSVIMPIRLPAICDYHQTRSPLEKGLRAGDYLTWAFIRYDELCLFKALHPAPLARPFSKGLLEGDYLTWTFIPLRRVVPLRGTLSCAFGAALLQGPTRGDYLTWAFMPLRRIVPLRSTLSRDLVRLSLPPYRHPERSRGIFVAILFLTSSADPFA